MNGKRSHRLSELKETDAGKKVHLFGWVSRRRDHGGLIFIDLRDRFGVTQLIFDPKKAGEAHRLAEALRLEWVISVRGEVRKRAPELVNAKMATGAIEVCVDELKILSKAKTPPFSIADDAVDVNEEVRLKYRYLDIRRGKICSNLVLRHKAMLSARQFLDSIGFLEITTPILAKSTPEGARDYLVPSRTYPGSFFALPQSPQLFKQLLMVGGIDRYFQFAPCFRDEDLRADRQPEFTQIDLEMSFSTQDELFCIVEGLVSAMFSTQGISLPQPFPIMTYEEAIHRFGTDKPDLRFGMELIDLTEIVETSDFNVFKESISASGICKGIVVKGGGNLTRKELEEYTLLVKEFGQSGLSMMKMLDGKLSSNIAKFFPDAALRKLIEKGSIEEGDCLLMVAGEKVSVHQSLDHLRRKIAKDRGLIDKDKLSFLWVVDFPLFGFNEEEGRLESMHHPFTSPKEEDIPLLMESPLSVRSSAYDIVLNGYEIGGGSMRIYSSELQETIFKILNLTKEEIQEKFGFFTEALQYGTPPHLGLALGFDRIMMVLLKTENIRDVIAFPKTQKASDLMMQCPSFVSPRQLKELGIKTQLPF